MTMRVLVLDSPDAAGASAADVIEAQVRLKPQSVLGLATGSSPIPIYRELVRRHREEGLSFAETTFFLLDEYVGLAADHACSYRHFIQEHFVDHVDVQPSKVNGLDGTASDLDAEALRYEQAMIASGGIDLQLLGLGRNGHIGFNEPGSPLDSQTRVATLTETTRQDNSRFFPPVDPVPVRVLTQGIGSILRARNLLVIATGAAKAQAVAATIEGSISTSVPGSAIRLHPEVTVTLDAQAAAHLRADAIAQDQSSAV